MSIINVFETSLHRYKKADSEVSKSIPRCRAEREVSIYLFNESTLTTKVFLTLTVDRNTAKNIRAVGNVLSVELGIYDTTYDFNNGHTGAIPCSKRLSCRLKAIRYVSRTGSKL